MKPPSVILCVFYFIPLAQAIGMFCLATVCPCLGFVPYCVVSLFIDFLLPCLTLARSLCVWVELSPCSLVTVPCRLSFQALLPLRVHAVVLYYIYTIITYVCFQYCIRLNY